jgi:hypothetical protein
VSERRSAFLEQDPEIVICSKSLFCRVSRRKPVPILLYTL